MDSRLGSVFVMVVVGTMLVGCTARSDTEEAPPSSSPSTTEASGSANSIRAPLECEEPPERVLDWAIAAIAAHPGPIRASSMVRAATADSGTWYVVAIDREYVLDDGTPTGDGSRTLALTNAIDRPRSEANMIPLGDGGVGAMGKPVEPSWRNTTWRGDPLRAGERAAKRAIACLDESGE